MLKIKIIGWNRYNFKDKQTGDMVKGCAINYIQVDSPVTDKEDRGGFEVIKGSVPYEVGEALKQAGGHEWYAEAGIGVKVYDGKAMAVITGIKIIAGAQKS